jgi:CheY-like chemotaxis protein
MFFDTKNFSQDVVRLGDAHGGPPFWYEVLREDSNPDNIWRALLYIGCLGISGPEPAMRYKLHHPDSRVRAWACFALGQLNDETAVERIAELETDPSSRVRIHAEDAIGSIVGHSPPNENGNDREPIGEALILISDDSAGVQNQLASALEPLGYPLAFASNEDETLAMALDLHPAAIITDNQKGKDNLNGLRMTGKIANHPELREVVLFMLTADALEGAFLWNGGDYFLQKTPECVSMLITAMQAYLARRPEIEGG